MCTGLLFVLSLATMYKDALWGVGGGGGSMDSDFEYSCISCKQKVRVRCKLLYSESHFRRERGNKQVYNCELAVHPNERIV